MSLFKNLPNDPSENPNFEPERQSCGFTVGILTVISMLVMVIRGPFLAYNLEIVIKQHLPEEMHSDLDSHAKMLPYPLKMTYPLWATISCRLGALIVALFFILALHNPKLLGGNPEPKKLLPLIVGLVMIFAAIPNEVNTLTSLSLGILAVLFYGGIAYGAYIKDDTNPSSCCLCLKPWIYKPKMMAYPPQGYPPYGAPAPHPQAYGVPSYQPQAYPQQPYPSHGCPPQQMIPTHSHQISPQMIPKV